MGRPPEITEEVVKLLEDANFGLNYLKLKCDDFKEKRKVNSEHEFINSDMSSSLAKLTDKFLEEADKMSEEK